MSVVVSDLTKIYGDQHAVDHLSFSVGKGEILGFLGPNGAGKSTTMKMITGYLQPTSGQIEVCGIPVTADNLETRKKIGYLPESNPLYYDMYVKEYLDFVSRIHKIPNRASKISELIDITGLGVEQKKKIGALSKGYKQRVGLAQALIHDPEVLILDEPTSGLDMNQLVDIRQLITDLGKEKTLIFSTHIMQEVQALCSRVIIIDQGKLVADDPIEALTNRIKGEQVISIELVESCDLKTFEQLPGVVKVQQVGKTIQITTTEANDIRADIFNTCVAAGKTMIGMKVDQLNVEDVFRSLTKSTADV